jgi:polar amino acid transport system substrate-binding protein
MDTEAWYVAGVPVRIPLERGPMPINIARRQFIAAVASTAFLQPLLTRAQQNSDPRIFDLVRNGKLRVGLGLANRGSAIKDPTTGELLGVAADLARALAARIGLDLQPVEYPRPGAVMDGAPTNAWDVAFLVIDPARSAAADFSPPYMQSNFTYLVPSASSIGKVTDADQPGIRIGVPRADAVDLVLSRILKHAELVRVENQAAGADLLRAGQISAYAAPRPVLLALSAELPGSHVIEDAFADISFAAFVPKGNFPRLAYVTEFLEEAKSSGLIQQFIEQNGLRGLTVAPPAKPN